MCKGGSSFSELWMMRGLKLSNGSVLVNGEISWVWQNILFWRTFFCIVAHYIAILVTCSLCLKLGWFSNEIVDTKIEDILERPAEDSATMFSFVKQQFFHKTLAYTKYEKDKKEGRIKRRCC